MVGRPWSFSTSYKTIYITLQEEILCYQLAFSSWFLDYCIERLCEKQAVD